MLLRQGSLIGTCAFVALILFVSFYMVVSGAVQRGPRLASGDPATPATATAQRSVGHRTALLARVGN